ncbi:glycoside hydrolase family 13 protein [Candidatus Galacturonibacter soehngenii]|uniref:Glycoside hydrolase family 13 protein n=1 Tax=Candidatus Galacturonatibacter soehngenii TaxID=2307010 RepID=A0A7V7QJ67_9FIRM|nr:glycoside hydrolase family 13 protein [Candidatus Galacturonibacter soehngenii]KAB1437633.1 glycoside hydrolase family 13 protein [Candidatus Galacturonibacter soehngenii]MBA4686859.1 glycoside hydrolase family 13 protein [Candidatus Galacturonibacter soehngenii]
MKKYMEENINREAILHIPLSQYAFADAENKLTIRIRTKKDNIESCMLYYGDRACESTPVVFEEIPMKKAATDEYFDYYEVTFITPFSRVCYYFKLENKKEWTFFYSDRFTKEMADYELDGAILEGRSEYYQYPYILKSEIQDVPNWFKTAVVYNIFPDSFACGRYEAPNEKKEVILDSGKVSKARLGGTIHGITQNLDYIQELGFNCIYLNPIFTAGEYHKYDTLDYYHIDPCLGTDEEFKQLVDEIHKKDMKIIIDGVFNHCSWQFFAFEDVLQNGKESQYYDWFYELNLPLTRPESEVGKPKYACFAYERKMPKLNTSNLEVQKYFAAVGVHWLEHYQIDGWRLDVANEIDREFWRAFRRAVKLQNKEAILIGEVWEDAQTWLKGDAFDSTMNYEFRRICRDYLIGEQKDAFRLAKQLEQMRLRYPTNIVRGQLNLLDSHDVPRFMSLCKGDERKWRLACILLMLFEGVPSLFYGDEQGICGVNENEYRNPMVWGQNPQLCVFVKRLIEIRKEYTDVTSSYQVLWEEMSQDIFAFERKNENGKLRVMFNLSDKTLECQKYLDDELLVSSKSKDVLEPFGYKILFEAHKSH